MAERAHLSIGEVLSLLQDEFPDVTISKIRFLESQGLLDPERTPSGYRKFYEDDVRRLRWILTEQRDKFLPLKVIKDRLDEGVDAERAAPDRAGNGAAAAVPRREEGGTDPPTDAAVDPQGAAAVDAEAVTAVVATPVTGAGAHEAGRAPGPGTQDAPTPAAPAAEIPSAAEPVPTEDSPPHTASLPIWMADAARAKADRGRSGRSSELGDGPDPLGHSPTTVSLTTDELLAASGLEPSQLASLADYGLVAGHTVGADTYYDGEDLVIAQKAAGFLAHGVEARHLRMFKTAAEREAALLEQLVLPLVKQRSRDARDDAQATVAELASLGQGLRAALLRAALAPHLA